MHFMSPAFPAELAVQAEERGLLVPHSGDTIYEGTVGSTGISLAAICRARGYKAHMYDVPPPRSCCA